ncbi:hypothetical protein [Jiella mangrovi]|uniref:Protamine-2 (Modular protein) n=1 Tax=Jiella mangrovi TaxID=2821407 RepID=A0ABS4BC55_9HYPH|nr:hypothetical protein [Jiella mangrovi]MBP0614334.1 hypothetical protein [Jiella mangrovi]
MPFFKMSWPFGRKAEQTKEAEPDLARRRVLFGLGAAGCAIVATALPFADHAEAAQTLDGDLLDLIDEVSPDEGEYETAHYTGYRHSHGRRRYRRRSRPVRRVPRQCRYRRFRRRNPRLCGVYRRPRRNCTRIGNVTVCSGR